ncbi:MAG: hypothetical protein IPQ03_13185 [Bacteroidetes bacterium]|nr:hypothetical protein [Bacteroidota bacterium]
METKSSLLDPQDGDAKMVVNWMHFSTCLLDGFTQSKKYVGEKRLNWVLQYERQLPKI